MPIQIHNITRLRVHTDGVGVRSVLFLHGCPLSCFWCCNPETRFGSFQSLEPKQLWTLLKQDLPYFRSSGGGITLSGGEPLLQWRALLPFLQLCKGISIDIETSLLAPQEALEALIPFIDTWNIDCKHMDDGRHSAFTGVSNRQIQENLRFLARHIPTEKIIITFPVLPGKNDDPENLRAMMAFLKELGIFRIELHPYRKIAEQKQKEFSLPLRPLPPLSPRAEQAIRATLRKNGFSLVEKESVSGRDKCRYLKQLRRQYADQHQIPLEIPECTYQGPCIGTCQRCEWELSQLKTEK